MVSLYQHLSQVYPCCKKRCNSSSETSIKYHGGRWNVCSYQRGFITHFHMYIFIGDTSCQYPMDGHFNSYINILYFPLCVWNIGKVDVGNPDVDFYNTFLSLIHSIISECVRGVNQRKNVTTYLYTYCIILQSLVIPMSFLFYLMMKIMSFFVVILLENLHMLLLRLIKPRLDFIFEFSKTFSKIWNQIKQNVSSCWIWMKSMNFFFFFDNSGFIWK